jgi:hypothetical protein
MGGGFVSPPSARSSSSAVSSPKRRSSTRTAVRFNHDLARKVARGNAPPRSVFRAELRGETNVVHPVSSTPFQRQMRPSIVISNEELHAYIDGALPAVRHFQVAAYLADHPSEAAHGEAVRAQIAAMKALFDPVLDEPVPRRLSRVLPQAPSPRRHRSLLLVATTTAAMIGIVGAVAVARTHISVVSGTTIHIPATTSRTESPTARPLPVLPPPPGTPRRPRAADL